MQQPMQRDSVFSHRPAGKEAGAGAWLAAQHSRKVTHVHEHALDPRITCYVSSGVAILQSTSNEVSKVLMALVPTVLWSPCS
jgi:hypothetical protein